MKHLTAILPLAALLLASCATSRQAQGNGLAAAVKTQAASTSANAASLALVQKVHDQRVYAQNIVASMTFSAQLGGTSVSLPGTISMRRDAVIRLQLSVPLIGSEVGRLEFTPDHVLLVDRIHKQYVKADYSQVGFLRDNGLNFYSLQSLLWNQLLLPGATKIGEADLQRFNASADASGKNLTVSLTAGQLSYQWNASASTGLIDKATVAYNAAGHSPSALTCLYSDFQPVGAKKFPGTFELRFRSSEAKAPKDATVKLELGQIKTNDNWDPETKVSSKYKEVDVATVLGMLLNQ